MKRCGRQDKHEAHDWVAASTERWHESLPLVQRFRCDGQPVGYTDRYDREFERMTQRFAERVEATRRRRWWLLWLA